MTENHTLRVRCWNCEKIFHVVVTPENHNVQEHYVLKIVPCPYCNRSCELTLTESQVSTISVYRGGNDNPIVTSLLDDDTVFPTRDPGDTTA